MLMQNETEKKHDLFGVDKSVGVECEKSEAQALVVTMVHENKLHTTM